MEAPKPTPLLGALAAGGTREERFEAELVSARPRLFRTALLLLGGREEAEDATQRALLRALESRHGFRGASGLYTWLYRILLNQCKDAWKRRQRAERWMVGPAERAVPEPAWPHPDAEQALVERERGQMVRRALARLDPRSREAIVLRHYEEMSYEEMAAVLGCPIGTVRSRLSAARERLRALLTAERVRA